MQVDKIEIAIKLVEAYVVKICVAQRLQTTSLVDGSVRWRDRAGNLETEKLIFDGLP